jgi:uncharacterized protein YkwD
VQIRRLVLAGARATAAAHGPALQADPRLDAAAAALLASHPGTDAIANDEVRGALWAAQRVEPVHRMMIVHYATSSPEVMLAALPAQIKVLLGTGRWQRCGVAVAPQGGPQADGDDSRAIILVQESFIQLEPPPPALQVGAAAPLSGSLLPPYDRPRLVVTAPGGASETPPLSVDGRAFRGALPCRERGRYQVEVLGEDRRGPTVLANFPWYCGEAPSARPSALAPSPSSSGGDPATAPWRDARDAEQQIYALLNQARRAAGLPALPLDEALSAVARAHCQDMAAHGFVGHISPRTGGPADRARRAGITAPLITENLAQARSPQEADQGLLDSPGHRANILDPRARRVGIAVQEITGVAGIRQLLVAELFVGQLATVDLSTAPTVVVSTLAELRKTAGQGAVQVDPELTALATRTAEGLAAGTIAERHPDALISAALPSLRRRFASVRAGLAVAQTPAQIAEVPTLVDAAATDIGVAVVPKPTEHSTEHGDPGSLLYIVLMVARRAGAP